MNKIVLVLLLLISSVSQAQLGWFILGSLLTKKSAPTVIINDEFSKNVDLIHSKIPYANSDLSTKPTYSFKVSDPNKIANFFKNEGYQVTVEKNEIIFNFEKQYNNSLARSKVIKENVDAFVSHIKTGALVTFSLIMLIGLIVGVKESFLVYEEMGLFKILPKNSKLRLFMDKREQASKKTMLENWHIIYPNGETKSLASIKKESVLEKK